MKWSFIGRVFFPLLAALLLSSCMGAPLATIGENSNDAGDVELILEPMPVWDDKGAGEAEQLEVDGKNMYFRVRPVDTFAFEREWARLGLFWHSKQKRINMPIVIVGGPPVKILEVHIDADRNSERLKAARNFKFKPGKLQPFEKQEELHSAVFSLSPKILAKIAAAEDVYVGITTNRGGLRLNLSVVTGRDNGALVNSAKYQFAEFSRRVQARQ